MFWKKRIKKFKQYSSRLNGGSGLEIGGPSWMFSKRGLIPLYTVLGGLDGCNFDTRTVWEGRIEEGPGNYRYDKLRPAGHQYIREAVDLRGLESEKYDVILSSHCIEHVANPLKAIAEWLRVLKTDGLFVLVVPHKDGTFDHKRPVTPWEHLVDDFERAVAEDDLTHLPEILELHDLAMDPPAGDHESFRRRSLKNVDNRCLHQHVFDTNLVVRLIDHFKLRILDVQTELPYHIIILAQKVSKDLVPDNSAFFTASAGYRENSPFPTDKPNKQPAVL